MGKILVVDDNPDILDALELLLSLHNYQVLRAQNKMDAILAVNRHIIDVVIQDMNFERSAVSGDEGKSLFYQIKDIKPDLPVVLITAWAQVETAVELVKAGAADYLQKPWDDDKLLSTVNKLCNAAEKPTVTELPKLIYKSLQMANLIHNAEKVAKSDINVLVTGANGVGKEKIADHIHQYSTRASNPFVKVNMGALPQELMEAELFGAEKGAYTGANEQRIGRFEAADGGTLFLDEIGNLSLSGQMKLLRVLQTGEFERLGSNTTIKVDVRVISATNSDLNVAITQGSFRQDLYYRLNVIELNIPELAQRKEDIVPLAKHFLGKQYQLTNKAEQVLINHDWPGNVRELENACQRATVFAQNGVIDERCFAHQQTVTPDDEKQRIEQALLKHNWVIKHAADELGLSRQALYRRIEKYQLEVND